MKRMVRGHNPAEPMIPRTWSAFDWTSPISTGAVPPTSMPTSTTRPPSAAIGKALAIAAGAPGGLDDDVEPASAGRLRRLLATGPAAGSITALAPISSASARRCACGSISVTAAPIVAGCQRTEEADRPAADDRDLVARVDAVRRDRSAVGDGERLDERPLTERELVGNAVEPGRLCHEVLGVGAADREAEVVVAVVDDALADDAVALRERGHDTPDLRDLARPLVAGDDRIARSG